MTRPARSPQYYRRRWLVRIAVWTVFGFWLLPHLLRRDGAWALTLFVALAWLGLNLYRAFSPRLVEVPQPVDRMADAGLQSFLDPGQNRLSGSTRREAAAERRLAAH